MERLRAILVVLSWMFGPVTGICLVGYTVIGVWTGVWLPFSFETFAKSVVAGMVLMLPPMLLYVIWMFSGLEMESRRRKNNGN